MSEYLQMFIDETEEQLEGLVETLLNLERNPESVDDLNEAFRLIHSIKGAAGMMGFDSIAALTHHLESRFERFRSAVEKLDRPTMNVVLRCIDFLRDCIRHLRAGDQQGSSAPLLEELAALDDRPAPAPAPASTPVPEMADNEYHLAVHFESGLPLLDLKAQLIVSRLSGLGEVRSIKPALDVLATGENPTRIDITLTTDKGPDAIRAAADVDGVHAIDLSGAAVESAPVQAAPIEVAPVQPAPPVEVHQPPVAAVEPEPVPAPDPEPASAPVTVPAPVGKSKVVETMRVDIDRLDNLMNLAGELVVNRARFMQVVGQVTPAFRKRNVINRAREFSENLRKTIAHLQSSGNGNGEWTVHIDELKAGLEFMEEQSETWENGRRCFAQISEAIDQLTRISDSLQQGVLDTRMAPVAPLFNRFKRVIRDISAERGKQVNLEIRGEKTELDKRMIDELGDPMIHLVRNSIDHGIESPQERQAHGKPQAGTILLEASHSGNNVFIHVRDDGRGIDVGRIRQRLIDREILAPAAAGDLTDQQAVDYIWHPGFSTASEVTDISGRGVGMDAVKTRITDLNGTIDVESTPGEGTTFTIRLPLTLAIINSLLIRIRNVIFAMPIEDVREIVSLPPGDIVTVHGRQTVDIRGEFIPLVGIDDIFDWNDVALHGGSANGSSRGDGDAVHAVVLYSGDKAMGLRVDELLGSQDIVIKSLAEHFVQIRGLSGASILGDGTVCLMLDVAASIDLAATPTRANRSTKGAAS
jgi:two-component system chemotaxis sensor kinase CheA